MYVDLRYSNVVISLNIKKKKKKKERNNFLKILRLVNFSIFMSYPNILKFDVYNMRRNR